jgi:hypothetical protein
MDNYKPNFIKASGYYTMEPTAFMHLWNQCDSTREVAQELKAAWEKFARNNELFPSKDGSINEPKGTESSIISRASTFRKKGVYMKKIKKSPTTVYDWAEIKSQSKQYMPSGQENSKVARSPSKSFFNRG